MNEDLNNRYMDNTIQMDLYAMRQRFDPRPRLQRLDAEGGSPCGPRSAKELRKLSHRARTTGHNWLSDIYMAKADCKDSENEDNRGQGDLVLVERLRNMERYPTRRHYNISRRNRSVASLRNLQRKSQTRGKNRNANRYGKQANWLQTMHTNEHGNNGNQTLKQRYMNIAHLPLGP